MSLYNPYRNLQWFLNTQYHLNSSPGAHGSLRSDPNQSFPPSVSCQTDWLAIPCACLSFEAVWRLLTLFVKASSRDQQHQFPLGACEQCRTSGPNLDLQVQNLHLSETFRWRLCTLNCKNSCETSKCFSVLLEGLLLSWFISLQNMWAPGKQRAIQITCLRYTVQPSETTEYTEWLSNKDLQID